MDRDDKVAALTSSAQSNKMTSSLQQQPTSSALQRIVHSPSTVSTVMQQRDNLTLRPARV